jgi:hypothetical protein
MKSPKGIVLGSPHLLVLDDDLFYAASSSSALPDVLLRLVADDGDYDYAVACRDLACPAPCLATSSFPTLLEPSCKGFRTARSEKLRL